MSRGQCFQGGAALQAELCVSQSDAGVRGNTVGQTPCFFFRVGAFAIVTYVCADVLEDHLEYVGPSSHVEIRVEHRNEQEVRTN